jgi:hypothetical protein
VLHEDIYKKLAECVTYYLYRRLISARIHIYTGARGSVVVSGSMLLSGRSQVRFPMRSLNFFNLSNPCSRTMALGSTQPLTEMSTRNLPGDKGRRTRKADKLTTICEPIV